ncbi:MAG: leucine-rich repeat domain-containing protein, partial [Promethearchaeota archaeon]
MSQKFTCAACGFAQDERTKSDAADRWLCPICTNTGVEGPDFETIVYEKAIAILNNRPNQEPQEALKEAYTFVAQLPYWQRKDLPSLPPTGLRTVQKTLLLSVNMGRLEVGREIIRPPDFFISHKQKEEPDRELVEPLVTGLKERGYHVWYDEDTWGTEAGKVTAWMERGIDQARHCITVLCQDYFASEVCIYELNYMLMKKAKFVFPIWWTDIDENFIEQKKRGIKLPDLPEIIIEWKDCKENMDILVEKLIEHVNAAEGLQDYNGVSLVADEVRMLKQLETSIDEVIPPLKQQELSSATFGFYAEKNRINALFLEEKGLQKLPKSLRQCVKLKWLHLRKNHNLFNGYVEIPTYLSTLQTLNLESNQLTSLPETIEHLTNLQELYLNNNLLVSLPETIGNLTKLETLQLQENKLTSLPASIGNLKSLQTLNLYNNQLASLPASIGNLQSLQNLELWRNKLTSLPASFGQLTQLVELNLGLNRLGSLPETIGNLTKLETLQLQENKLTSLPESVGNLTNLHVFNLWHNLLESLPKSFGNLTNLR